MPKKPQSFEPAEPSRPLTLREALLSRLKTYREEVASGRHVPPPGLHEEALRILKRAEADRRQP